MNDCHRRLVIVDRVLNSLADQTLGTFARHWLDANTGALWEANFFDAHFLDQEIDHLLRALGTFLPLDARVNIFGVLAENHHVGFLGLAQRRWHAFEVAHRAQADIQIELLTQSHVQRADTATDRRCQRALDRHYVILQNLQRFFRQPNIRPVHLGGFLASVNLHPADLALATVSLRHRSINHLDHDRADIHTGTIALDKGDDRVIGDVQRVVSIDGNFLTLGGHLNMLVHRFSPKIGG